jgi:3-deoxy-7-phosphoheptulonate synthase
MVDMSHANSAKDHKRQLVVCEDVCAQIVQGDRNIVGVMIESNLIEGRQTISEDLEALTYGQSITDACIDWSDTESALGQLSTAIGSRRS